MSAILADDDVMLTIKPGEVSGERTNNDPIDPMDIVMCVCLNAAPWSAYLQLLYLGCTLD